MPNTECKRCDGTKLIQRTRESFLTDGRKDLVICPCVRRGTQSKSSRFPKRAIPFGSEGTESYKNLPATSIRAAFSDAALERILADLNELVGLN